VVTTWAQAEGYTIVREHHPWLDIGPFVGNVLGKQVVRRLTIRDREGRERTCWLLLGDFFLGLFDERVVKVVWE
jgi:hypothetical protein